MSPDEARKAEYEARRAVRLIESEAERAGREAATAAAAAYCESHDLAGAKARLADATKARIAAEDALPDHEWDGRRVFRLEETGNRWRREQKRIEGVVETVRSTTRWAANTGGYRIPDIGEPIVRLLKKDGTTGLKFEKLHRGYGTTSWKLVEDGQ